MTAPNTYGDLVPCGGGDSIPLFKRKLLIGRRSNCDVILNFPNVSSQHCELELINGYWHIKDLNSSNGIKVNDIRSEAKWLHPGDIVSIAKHRYEIVYTALGDAPVENDEDPFARSLLEKAGIERRPRPTPSAKPTAAQQAPAPKAKSTQKSNPDDDEALRWLAEDA